MVHSNLQEIGAVTTKKKNHLHFWRSFSANHNQAYPKVNQKKQTSFRLSLNCVDPSWVGTVYQIFISILISYTSSIQQSKLFFSFSCDSIEWSLNIGPDSVTLTVKDIVQEMTRKTQKIPLADWSLLLSEGQEILNNYTVPVLIAPTRKGQGRSGMKYSRV